MPCANCRQDLLRQGEIDEGEGDDDDQLATISVVGPEDGEKTLIPVSEAIKTVFEGSLRLNKKQISPQSRIKMCHTCLHELTDLHRSYTKFMELTTFSSYIQQLLVNSVLWSFGGSPGFDACEDDAFSHLACEVEVKMEVGDDEEGKAVYIKAEDANDPDFVCNYNEEEEFPFVRATRRTTAERFSQRKLGAKTKAAASRAKRPAAAKRSVKSKSVDKLKRAKTTQERKTGQSGSEEKAFKCTEVGCKQAFNSGKVLRRHTKFHHGIGLKPEELEAHTCKKCSKPKVFATLSQLKSHVEGCHSIVFPFECDKCDRQFPTQNRLNIHKLMKHERAPAKEKDPILCHHNCTETFRTKANLQVHLKKVHNEQKTYNCACGKKFMRSSRYRRHLKYKHGEGLTEADIEGRICSQCAKIFETPSQLRYHKESVHATEKPFKCEEPGCARTFPTKNYLSIHRLLKHERVQIRHPCDKCHKTYSSKHALTDHVDSVHLRKRNIVCEICGKACSRKNELNRHMETHDPSRKPSWKCDECGQLFISDKTLRSHMKTHSGVKDQLCPVCGDAFLHTASLRRHLAAKHDVYANGGVDKVGVQHTCDQCGKSFKLKEYLRQHMRSRTHGGKGHTAQRKRERDRADPDDGSTVQPRPKKAKPQSKADSPHQQDSSASPASIQPQRYELPHPLHPALFWAGHGHSVIPGNSHYY